MITRIITITNLLVKQILTLTIKIITTTTITINKKKLINNHKLISICHNILTKHYFKKRLLIIIIKIRVIIIIKIRVSLFITVKRLNKYPHKLIMLWWSVVITITIKTTITIIITNITNNKKESYRTKQNKVYHPQKQNLSILSKMASL